MNSKGKKAIVTIVIGEKFQSIFDKYFKEGFLNYSRRLNIPAHIIMKPIEPSDLAYSRSFAWQKLLLFHSKELNQYEEICWLDSDIYLSNNCENIFDFDTEGKWAAVTENQNLTPPSLIKSVYSSRNIPVLDVMINTGVMILNRESHSKILEELYYYEPEILSGYEKTDNGWFEQPFLSSLLLNECDGFILPTRFNKLVNRERSLVKNSKTFVSNLFHSNSFLHWAGRDYDENLENEISLLNQLNNKNIHSPRDWISKNINTEIDKSVPTTIQHSNTKLLSVYMVAYNSEKYIGQAIQSVLDQTYNDFEFIIVNDGSTDRTDEIIKSFSDNRIIYVPKKHENFAKGMNVAIQKAQGEFILGVDSDDYIDPNYLLKIFKFALDNPGYDYYYPEKLTHIDINNHLIGSNYIYYSMNSEDVIYKMFNLASTPIPNPGSLKRKSIFSRLGLYSSLETIEDFAFLSENALGIRFKMCQEVNGYYYRKSISSNSNRLLVRNKIMSEYLTKMLNTYSYDLLFPEIKNIDDQLVRLKIIYQAIVNKFNTLAHRYKDNGGVYYLEQIKTFLNNPKNYESNEISFKK